MDSLKIFISSPGDVAEERALCAKVIQRLSGEFAHRVELHPIFWEHEPLRASGTFQDDILLPSETDIVVSILWTRLGTRLPKKYRQEGDELSPTGTEFEVRDALKAYEKFGNPDLLIYKKTAEPMISTRDRDNINKVLEQQDILEQFTQKFFFNEDGTIKAAFHTFEKSSIFEESFEMHLRKLIDRKAAPAAEGSERLPSWTNGSPFRGLERFDIEHAQVFFGRGRAISEVLSCIKKPELLNGIPAHFVLVQGMSGSGKSSLVCAGILPLLMEPGVIEGVGLWRYAIMKASDSNVGLLHALTSALCQKNALPELVADGTSIDQLSQMLHQGSSAIVPLLKGGLSQVASTCQLQEKLPVQPVSRLVLILDQLEEVFTMDSVSDEERHLFFQCIADLATSGLIYVIGTLRSDFYHRCEQIPQLVELKKGNGQYHLLPPVTAELSHIIRQPAQAAGLRYETDAETGLSVADLILEEAQKSPEALPLLEFCLERLYEVGHKDGVLSFAEYEKIGRFEGSLANCAEEAFANLSELSQKEFRSVFSKVLDVEEDSAVRRWVDYDELCYNAEAKALVEDFINKRLLIAGCHSADETQVVVSISHEVLLRNWSRLTEMVTNDRSFFLNRGQIEQSASQWEKNNKESSFLLHEGKALATANGLLESRSDDLEKHLVEYIEVSMAVVEKAKSFKRNVIMATIVALLILTSVSVVMGFKANVNAKEAIAQKILFEEKSQDALAMKKIAEEKELQAKTQRNKAQAAQVEALKTLLIFYGEKSEQAMNEKRYVDAAAWKSEMVTIAEQTGGNIVKYQNSLKYTMGFLSYFLWESNTTPSVMQAEHLKDTLWMKSSNDRLLFLEKNKDGAWRLEPYGQHLGKVLSIQKNAGAIFANSETGVWRLPDFGNGTAVLVRGVNKSEKLLSAMTINQSTSEIMIIEGNKLKTLSSVSGEVISEVLLPVTADMWRMVYDAPTQTLVTLGTEDGNRNLYVFQGEKLNLVHSVPRLGYISPCFALKNSILYYVPTQKNFSELIKVKLAEDNKVETVRMPYDVAGMFQKNNQVFATLQNGHFLNLESMEFAPFKVPVDHKLDFAISFKDFVLTAADDSWQLRSAKTLEEVYGYNKIPALKSAAEVSETSMWLATVNDLRLVNVASGELIKKWPVVSSAIAYNKQDKALYSLEDGTLRLYKNSVNSRLNSEVSGIQKFAILAEGVAVATEDEILLLDSELKLQEKLLDSRAKTLHFDGTSLWFSEEDPERYTIKIQCFDLATRSIVERWDIALNPSLLSSSLLVPESNLYICGLKNGSVYSVTLGANGTRQSELLRKPSSKEATALFLENKDTLIIALKGGMVQKMSRLKNSWKVAEEVKTFDDEAVERIYSIEKNNFLFGGLSSVGYWKFQEQAESAKSLPPSTVRGDNNAVYGNRLATCQGSEVHLQQDGKTVILGGNKLGGEALKSLKFTRSGKYLIASTSDSGLMVWAFDKEGQIINTKSELQFPLGKVLAFSLVDDDHISVLSGNEAGLVELGELGECRVSYRVSLPQLKGSAKFTYIESFSDGFAISSEDTSKLVFINRQSAEVTEVELPEQPRSLARAAGKRQLLVGGVDCFYVVDLREKKVTQKVDLPNTKSSQGKYVRKLCAISGSRFVLAGGQSAIYLSDLDANCCFARVSVPEYVWQLSYSAINGMCFWQGKQFYGSFSLSMLKNAAVTPAEVKEVTRKFVRNVNLVDIAAGLNLEKKE
jgi:hypothetical protein